MAVSMRDEPGTQREFETVFILRAETNQDGIHTVNSRVRQVIEQMGGRLLKLDNWGKRKLAYTIDKFRDGSYVLFSLSANGAIIREVERRLRVMDLVIKYLTVRMDEDQRRLDKIKAHRQKRAARRGASAGATSTPAEQSAEDY